MKKGKNGLFVALVIIATLATLFFLLVGFITDYLWFKELSYTSVFFRKLFTQLKLGIPTFIIITLLSYIYLMALKKGYYKKIDIQSKKTISEKALNGIGLGLSAIFGLLITFTAVTGLWFEILKFIHSTPFDIKDPIFNLDISFYIFKLDFILHLNSIALSIVVAFFVITFLFYLALLSFRSPEIFEEEVVIDIGEEQERPRSPYGNLGDMFDSVMRGQFKRPQQPRGKLDKDNLRHLLSIASNQIQILGVLFFLLVAVNFWLKQYSLLYSSRGVLYGAGFTDIYVTLTVYRILFGLAILAAILFVMAFKKKNIKLGVAVPIIMIVLSLAGSGVASMVQSLIVSPDEIQKESPYLRNNIKFTQMAYDLQDVKIREFAASNTLTKEDIANNMGTISNIRINDFLPALKFYNQAQSIRTYYQFNDVDVDRYVIDGKYTQTFQSAREIDDTKIETQPWMSKHLKYTHGYGITLSRVDKVTASGQPDMLVNSIPPVSSVKDDIDITRPEIYFGESTQNYIITNTDEKEFDYPSGDKNIYTIYEGSAGIPLTPINRVLFAIRENSLKILVSNNISSESKIVINRNIAERVKKIAPFIQYDADPYIVTVDGKLYWLMDGYTYSSNYPYSEPFAKQSRVNYIRNSIKVVIDAYNGETNFYLVDNKDPIALTLQKIYPKLFKDFSEMPESLQKHIRYPNMLFSIQAGIYAKYHMSNVEVFYQSEDKWEISKEIFGTEQTQMKPNYYILKIPGEDRIEFVNSVPYTPAGKKNMIALLVARNDGENYGELILLQLPKSKIIYGPEQIEGFIDQDTNISKEFTLWSSSGSNYMRGNMFVIPIEDSLVYVEPVYLEATNSSLPEVKRVIVYYNDKIAYEPSLGAALESMFGSGASKELSEIQKKDDNEVVEQPKTTKEQLIEKAVTSYDKAIEAQQAGNWAEYGTHLDELGKALEELEEMAEQ